jgi:hypothetical protein
MARPRANLTGSQSLYDRDFFAWTQHQADLLRRAAAREPTSDLDFDHLAEEIESLGKRDRRALASHVARITEHLLKLQYARDEEPRPGWENSVDAHRSKARRILADSPGLKGEVATLLNESYEDGRRLAARSLRSSLDPAVFPRTCPYSIDQLLDRDWWPSRS